MSLEEIRKIRLKKLKNILKVGLNPYPNKTERSLTILRTVNQFNSLAKKGRSLILVGRIRSIRFHGGCSFAHIEDGSGKIQIYLKQDILKEKYKFFLNNFDIGDFIEVKGKLFKTKRGEKTLEVTDCKILAKSLRPLPEKWHGLKDVEERFRKRYLDLIFNPETKERFGIRSKIIKLLREFLEKNSFIEVETPILQSLPGGALAKPFRTHLNVLDIDLYLRIAPELYLKRLLVGGFEKVYEIGRCFRNEGMDKLHNPDFTMLEFYWAYANYEDLMKLTEKMFSYLVPKKEIVYQGQKINFKPPFKKVAMADLLLKEFNIDIDKVDEKEIMAELKKQGVKPEDDKPCRAIDALFKLVRPKLIEPTFVIDYPLEMSPLAKEKKINGLRKKYAERFQLIVGGLELINAYTELNDPEEQARRMKEQEKLHKDEVRYDEDFIEALEYGLPPAAGFGLGVDRLVQLLTDTPNIREVILFPIMRPR